MRPLAAPAQARCAGRAGRRRGAGSRLDEDLEVPPYRERRSHRALPRRHAKAFRDLLELEGQAFLERIDAWLAERADKSPRKANERTVRTGVGVYLIHDDERGERS